MEESMWNLLPDTITKTIFSCIYIGDRVRLRLVCKSWNRMLLQDCLPTSPEAPWEILSTDSYKNPQPYLTEVLFRSLSEDRIYRFKLPPNLQSGSDGTDGVDEARGWLCGSSRGWLVLAVGQKFNPDMMLWNPLLGAAHKLPPLSTLPFFDDCLYSPPRAIKRVEVFSTSTSSNECIVAALFATSGPVRMALSTPQEKKWSEYLWRERRDAENKSITLSDILFCTSDGTLHVVSNHKFSSETVCKNMESVIIESEVCLADCRVKIEIMFEKPNHMVPSSRGLHVYTSTGTSTRWHLAESSVTGELMLVGAEVDNLQSTHEINPIMMTFICSQTKGFCVYRFGRFCNRDLDLSKEAIFLGATGAVCHPFANGIQLGCIYFALDNAIGLVSGHSEFFIIREHGVYELKPSIMNKTLCRSVRDQPGSKVGWFVPRLYT